MEMIDARLAASMREIEFLIIKTSGTTSSPCPLPTSARQAQQSGTWTSLPRTFHGAKNWKGMLRRFDRSHPDRADLLNRFNYTPLTTAKEDKGYADFNAFRPAVLEREIKWVDAFLCVARGGGTGDQFRPPEIVRVKVRAPEVRYLVWNCGRPVASQCRIRGDVTGDASLIEGEGRISGNGEVKTGAKRDGEEGLGDVVVEGGAASRVRAKDLGLEWDGLLMDFDREVQGMRVWEQLRKETDKEMEERQKMAEGCWV
ncbi:Hypothetical protein D9617_18g034460 [Elsinoe fawcettii]|nr:Hypothetical protein D9617_18g034460 [Elsinoe fawcettii]